jgi:hypothetical protein
MIDINTDMDQFSMWYHTTEFRNFKLNEVSVKKKYRKFP